MQTQLQSLADDLASGRLIPFLGAGALEGSVDMQTGEPIPADSDSLIIAMNKGQPMAPKLMWEFSRAAMNIELKRGRKAVTRFLEETYGDPSRWTRAPLHEWLQTLLPPYVIDINRDTQLQDSFSATPHSLIRGLARIGGTDYRFRIDHYDGTAYREIDQADMDLSLPMLFKPMGSPNPAPGTYIASDADYVDYLTELMGGFGVPAHIKTYRRGRRYLLLGLRLTRDTERMVLSDLVYGAGTPTGYALIAEPTDKEQRFCERLGIEIIEAGIPDLLAAAGFGAELPTVSE
jgi:hypothetical protein